MNEYHIKMKGREKTRSMKLKGVSIKEKKKERKKERKKETTIEQKIPIFKRKKQTNKEIIIEQKGTNI